MTKKGQPHHVSGAIRPQHAKQLSPKPVLGRALHGHNPSVTAAPYAARPSSPKASHSKKDKA
jgi:hypothetical protein